MPFPRLFNSYRKTPAELYRTLSNTKPPVPSADLRKGANRQWRRLHDPEFQTREMIDAIDRAVPKPKQ